MGLDSRLRPAPAPCYTERRPVFNARNESRQKSHCNMTFIDLTDGQSFEPVVE